MEHAHEVDLQKLLSYPQLIQRKDFNRNGNSTTLALGYGDTQRIPADSWGTGVGGRALLGGVHIRRGVWIVLGGRGRSWIVCGAEIHGQRATRLVGFSWAILVHLDWRSVVVYTRARIGGAD